MALEVVQGETGNTHHPHHRFRRGLWKSKKGNAKWAKLNVNQWGAVNLVASSLSGPPSWVTASTKRLWSSGVHLNLGLASDERASPKSRCLWSRGIAFSSWLCMAPLQPHTFEEGRWALEDWVGEQISGCSTASDGRVQVKKRTHALLLEYHACFKMWEQSNSFYMCSRMGWIRLGCFLHIWTL